MTRFKILIIAVMLIVYSSCTSRDSGKPPSPPRGYPNLTLLKAALVVKLEKLIDTKPAIPDSIQPFQDLVYKTMGARELKLDIYRKRYQTQPMPVLIFIHGGAWKTGDRSQYTPLGNRYAREGYVTVVPSYRLAPKNPHPAQIEDAAAAFAWTFRHIAEYGGDTNRIYVAGHSAGGHLAALLSLNERHLARHELSPKQIRGVLALSGVYDLAHPTGQDTVFGNNPQIRREASPLYHIKAGAPPFLVTYCEWDYFSLPAQARQFHRALQQAEIAAKLIYIPGENHISEMLNVPNENDPTVAAVRRFMK